MRYIFPTEDKPIFFCEVKEFEVFHNVTKEPFNWYAQGTHWRIEILHLWCKYSITEGRDTVNVLSMDTLGLHRHTRAGQLGRRHSFDPLAGQSLPTSQHHVFVLLRKQDCEVIGTVFIQQITLQTRFRHKKLIWWTGQPQYTNATLNSLFTCT